MNDLKTKDISVLCVEDDETARNEITLFLKRRAKEVFTASNGEEGLALYREKQPDLIITDIRMPVMDGLTMARSVMNIYKGALIIITTAHTDTPYLLEAIDTGINQFVNKPVNMEKLEAALEKCIEIIEYRRAHKRYLAEREKLIADLQKALSEIKTLRGIIPICSHCKKIRDDRGAWTQMESYISQHSEAMFSHGICSDCAKKHYPEYYKEEMSE